MTFRGVWSKGKRETFAIFFQLSFSLVFKDSPFDVKAGKTKGPVPREEIENLTTLFQLLL